MARVIFVHAILVLCFMPVPVLGQVPIVDGSFVPGPNPPTGIGDCWHINQQQFVPVQAIENMECEGFTLCEPISNCELTNPSPNGCEYRKTQDYRLVGSCQVTSNTFCYQCPPGSSIFCMSYEFFERKHPGGACTNPCNEFQVHFGGACVY